MSRFLTKEQWNQLDDMDYRKSVQEAYKNNKLIEFKDWYDNGYSFVPKFTPCTKPTWDWETSFYRVCPNEKEMNDKGE